MITQKPLDLHGRKIVVIASGSIAAIKTPILVSNLVKSGAEVRCVVTPSATNLVSPLALATISRNRCYQDSDQWDPIEPRPLHIELAEWAEVIVIAPMSASTLGRWTNGIAEGLAASLLIASEKPVIAAAAMNTGMWENYAIKRNWEELTSRERVLMIEPSFGLLACDRVGEGRMAGIELIELAINHCFLQKDKKDCLKKDWEGVRFLVSAGPTTEYIDIARTITNRSTGQMGLMLAQAAKFRGAKVHLIHGGLQTPASWEEGLSTHPITSSADMDKALKELQPTADVIVMAAAISDIRIRNCIYQEKTSKENLIKSLTKDLELVPDLLAEAIKRRSKNQIFLGFAALTGNDEKLKRLGEEKRQTKGCELLLANPIDIEGQGLGGNMNGGWLLGPKNMAIKLPVTTKLDLAHQLLDALYDIKANFSK